MNKDETTRRIWDFLSVDIPSSSSARFPQWKEQCKHLGASAPVVFLKALREGTETQQNVAVIALRFFGFESKAEGYGKERVYLVKQPGSSEWTPIIPIHPPDRAY